MQVRLLGPIDVVLDGVARPVRGPRRKAVLAVLALHRGTVVSSERLIDIAWGPAAPAVAPNTLQSHISYLRGVLGDRAAIAGRAPGYLLDLGAGSTDVEVAERLISDGADAPDLERRSQVLRTALALWRGPPLADVANLSGLDEQVQRFDQLRLRAIRSLVGARLAMGEELSLIPDLEQLTRQHPFDEQLQADLILALYRAGRQADALAAYQRVRRILADELGIDPSQPLRELAADILRQAPVLDLGPVRPGPPPPAAATGVAPAQLPAAVRAFVGRAHELAALDDALGQASQVAGAVFIAAVSGSPGIGKTALAVHWAHQTRNRFGDGQLYVDLGGAAHPGAVVEPATAVRGFLDALGVAAEGIPTNLAAQSALLRGVLAGKRVLIVLDNARDADQVRPLLPGTAGCAAIVTSRHQLTDLVAREGAHALRLDVLGTDDAYAMLAGRLGRDRVAAEPLAAADIIERCARLPLALSVVAARAAINPDFPLAIFAAELRQTADTLDAWCEGDIELRAVFSWSYHALPPSAARLFRLLGLYPGLDVSVAGAASLIGADPGEAEAALGELTAACLINQHRPGRYAFHALLRSYAADQCRIEDPAPQRRAAIHRILDYYLHSADGAARRGQPAVELSTLDESVAGVTAERPVDVDAASAWFASHRSALRSVVGLAVETGFDAHAIRLARTITADLAHHAHWRDLLAVQQDAARAALRRGDQHAQAEAWCGIAAAHHGLGHHGEARADAKRARDLYCGLGDLAGQGRAALGIALAQATSGHHQQAIEECAHALLLLRAAADRVGQARAHNLMGWCHAELGDHRPALAQCTRSLALLDRCHDHSLRAATLDSLGYIHRRIGAHPQALTLYGQAVAALRATGDRFCLATTLTNLGDAYRVAGDRRGAVRHWNDALNILDELGHPTADDLRTRLSATVLRS